MKIRSRWIIRREELNQCRKEIERENRSAFRLLSSCGLLISFFNYLVQLVVTGAGMPLFQSGLLFAYFSLLFFIDRCVIPEDTSLSTFRLYIAQAVPMALAILLGTLWDRDRQATTIMMFLMFLPVFVIDHFPRFIGIQGLWTLLFSALCLLCKKPPILYADLMHALEFYVASCTLMYVVSIVRLQSLQRQQKMQYHLTHDSDTDCQNRIALEERRDSYLERELLILIGVPDHLTMVNDFYGFTAANTAEKLFTCTLMDVFGPNNVYTRGGKEILCILSDGNAENSLEQLKQCRKTMHGFEFDGKKVPITCAFGYVTGNAANRDRFDQMIEYAEIFLRQAETVGNDQTSGGPFDQKAFQTAAMVVSHTSVQPNEISELTGMPRLFYFTARARELLENVTDLSRRPVVGFIRLTRLREYNDALGYAKGDELIRETGRQLRRAFYSRLLCHITAGQFCVLCYRNEVDTAIHTLCEALSEFGQGAMGDCKAGFAEYTGTEQVITLIDHARLAQKSILPFRNQHLCFYDTALDEELRFRQYIVNHIDDVIQNNDLIVYFQPIVRTATGEVCSEEALSRWNDPNFGLLMPGQFIPPLEENGLMYKVNLHVIEQVLENFRQRQKDGVPIVPVSVNLSRKDFSHCDMVQEIISRVDRSGFSRDLLRIEITESAFIADQELLLHEIERFRANGFQVWLDDFGSEYSTLNLLEEVDFDLLKIDMKFMNNFTGEGKNFVIVSHTISMARQMGMITLMEGVETEEQLQFMRKLGCDMIQGYLFDKPCSYEKILEHTKNGTGLRYEQRIPATGSAQEKGAPV